MPRRARGRKVRRKSRFRVTEHLPARESRRRWLRAFLRVPLGFQFAFVVTLLLTAWLGINWVYQVARKPSELFFPASEMLYKTPTETWRSYSSLFRKHSTSVITPEFLAALAQIEGTGNPIVRTYWRFAFTTAPFDVYKPASSAVGMYQITDGTFAEARRYCIHRNMVVEDGPWHQWRSCWFNSLYTRVVSSHAVEMTSAYLDRRVAQTLERFAIVAATTAQMQDLAAVIHLCGAGAGADYARRGLRLAPAQHCGDHEVRAYLAKVNAMKERFTRHRREHGL